MLLALSIFFITIRIGGCSGTRAVLTNFTTCGQPMIYVNLECKIGEDNIQKCNATHKSPVDDGENFKVRVVIEMFRNGNWRKILTTRENKGLCKLLETYLKEMVFDGFARAGKPRKCPMLKGTYYAKDHPISFEEIFAIGLPRKPLRLHVESFEKSTGKLGICAGIEIGYV